MKPFDQASMAALSPWEPGGFALAVFAMLVGGIVVALLVLTSVVNPRRPGREKDRPYECGVIPTPEPRFRYPAPFALVAMAFLIFDVETAFILTWAVSFTKMTWAALAGITVFIGVLLLSLWYLWIKGGLQWGMASKK